jgi:hypothetical protein
MVFGFRIFCFMIYTWLLVKITYDLRARSHKGAMTYTEPLRVTENPMQLGIVLEYFFKSWEFAKLSKGEICFKVGNPNWQKPKIT